MNPEYPVYIISKGRWESRLTSKALERMNVPYKLVIEPCEYDRYAAVVDPSKILILPFNNLGQGSIPARNWVWEHSISIGAERHWILDDNISAFFRLHQNIEYYCDTGTLFKVAEDFVDRYENIALAGLEYEMFLPRKRRKNPFQFNRRIYSCILIQNNIPYRWRGRYNEDTDLSIRVLKDRWCTILFYIFLMNKIATMRMGGGNTDSLYKDDGRMLMAQSLKEQHPEIVEIVQKYGRYHHKVDYSNFKANKPILKPGIVISTQINNYGMKLVNLAK